MRVLLVHPGALMYSEIYLRLEPLGKLLTFEIVEAEIGGDGEAGRNWNADHRHLGKTGALAAENVFHGSGAIGAALPEGIDQRLRVGTAHAGVGMRGVACRSRICWSSGVGVGYLPEKQA